MSEPGKTDEKLSKKEKTKRKRELMKEFADNIVELFDGMKGHPTDVYSDDIVYDVINDMYPEFDRAKRDWKKKNTAPKTPEQIAEAKLKAQKKAAAAKRRREIAALRTKIEADVITSGDAAMISTCAQHLGLEVDHVKELFEKKKKILPYWSTPQIISEIVREHTKLPG